MTETPGEPLEDGEITTDPSTRMAGNASASRPSSTRQPPPA